MQYLVNVGRGDECKHAFIWWKEHGYEISSSLTNGTYPYSTVVIDYGVVFGGNVTCFATVVSTGNKVMSWADWLQAKQANKLFC